jgi:hypothetical protein
MRTPYGASNRGNLLAASNVPSDSPLWAILNSRASGNAGLTPVTVGGVSWPTYHADWFGDLASSLERVPINRIWQLDFRREDQ